MFNLIFAIAIIASSIFSNIGFDMNDFNRKVESFYSSPNDGEDKSISIWKTSPVPMATAAENTSFSPLAKSYYAIDISNGQMLAAKNENQKLQVASLTKLMTAYVVLKDLPLEKEVAVPNFITRPGDSLMGIRPNERLTVRDLLSGMLINSGGDAAQALAISDSGSGALFVSKMNKTASDLGLRNTHFQNPVGWDHPDNYSSAYDISLLSRILLDNHFFAETVKKRQDTVFTKKGRAIPLRNTNDLLGGGNVGVKTGYTPGAGQCLANLQVSDNHKFLTVIIGSNDRFGQTRLFLDWIRSHYSW